jgi:ATP-dependent helicase/DNAse subunit B
MIKLKRWSVSKLKCYQDCPFKFYCNYVLEEFSEEKAKALTWGSSFHQCAEHAFSNFTFPPKEYLLKYYKDHWIADDDVRDWNKAVKKDIPRWQFLGYDSPDEELEYFKVGQRLISDFWDRHHLMKKLPFAVELLFEEKLPTGDFLKGYIDRVDLPSNYRILDYKTGKWEDTQEKLKDDLQLGLYQWAFCKKFNLPYNAVEYCALYYVRSSNLVPVSFVGIEIDKILEKTSAIITKVGSGLFPQAPREVWICKNCAYKHGLCDAPKM